MCDGDRLLSSTLGNELYQGRKYSVEITLTQLKSGLRVRLFSGRDVSVRSQPGVSSPFFHPPPLPQNHWFTVGAPESRVEVSLSYFTFPPPLPVVMSDPVFVHPVRTGPGIPVPVPLQPRSLCGTVTNLVGTKVLVRGGSWDRDGEGRNKRGNHPN